jgi:hypothetical protein
LILFYFKSDILVIKETDLCDRWWPELVLLPDWVEASGRLLLCWCWWREDLEWARLEDDRPPAMELE